MARIKSNRTERITLMLAPEEIRYLVELAQERRASSISAMAQQVILEHRTSFFECNSIKVEENTKVEIQPA